MEKDLLKKEIRKEALKSDTHVCTCTRILTMKTLTQIHTTHRNKEQIATHQYEQT